MTVRLCGMAWALAGFILLAAGASKADPITVTYGAAGAMTPNAASVCGSTAGCTVGYETFNYATPSTLSSYTSNFARRASDLECPL